MLFHTHLFTNLLINTVMFFYTGSYTVDNIPLPNPKGQGIGCFHLDQSTGEITRLRFTPQRNPSYLTLSEDRRFLYAVEEMEASMGQRVFAYRIEGEGELSILNSQELTGAYACHLALVKDRLVVANYMSGNAQSYPVNEDGSLEPCHQIIQHEGKGPNQARQEGPHAHMIYPFANDHLFLVDLGIDRARAYRMDAETNEWVAVPEMDLVFDPGAGPRHMVMNALGDRAFVLSELSGEVFVFGKADNQFKQIQKISIVPENFAGKFGGAAIRLHPNGKFLYASNRGPDSITIFKVDETSGKLSLVACQSTGGKTPRDFNIDPSGKWLIAANQDSNALVVFKIDPHTGTLTQTSTTWVGTPVNVSWGDK